MSKLDFQGWKKVYRFTLQQQWKSKAAKIMTVIFLVIAIAAPVLIDLLSGTGDTQEYCEVETLAVTAGSGDTEDSGRQKAIAAWISQTAYFKDTKVVGKDENPQILMHVNEQPGLFEIMISYDSEQDVRESDANDLAAYLEKNWKQYLVGTYGVTPETIAAISQPVDITVTNTGEEAEAALTEGEYNLANVLIVVLVMILAFSGEIVAASVVTEKSSKVIELLMTSMKPMAIVIGKVLAMLTYIGIQIVVLFVGFFGGAVVYENISAGSFQGIRMPEAVTKLLSSTLPGVSDNWLIVPAVLVLCLLGLVLFGVLAALAGATVSRVEELAEGIKVYSFVLVICAYVGIALGIAAMAGGANEVLTNIALLFPLTTLFVAPVYALLGKTTLTMLLIAIVLLVIAIYLLLRFVANVYGYLIYHKGTPVKWKQLLGIAGIGKRQGGESHE